MSTREAPAQPSMAGRSDGSRPVAAKQPSSPSIAIIGSGFGGLGMAYYLKQAGLDNFTIFEKAAGLGGVWRENTYPGAACDVPSHLYSFSFEPHYPWSRRYGPQAEILKYQHHVAAKYDLERHFRFGHELSTADYDEARGLWRLRFANGQTHETQILITAVGQLHRPQIPDFPGRDSFKGRTFHSATWDHAYDFHGKTVAVIGTGASAVQFVPVISQQVKQLHVFQRTPGWCIPKLDRVFNRFERWLLDRVPAVHDLDRGRIFLLGEFMTTAMVDSPLFKWLAAGVLRLWAKWHLWRQIPDPMLRRTLTPDTPIGCKRTLFSNEWLPALARPNVELVTEAIREITPTGVRGVDGKLRDVDAIIWGTGFAATEFLAPMQIRGLRGRALHERWNKGAEAYLGVAVSGFPNLFMLYGPNTNCGACSIIYMLERQSRYIVQCVQTLAAQKLRQLDVKPEAEGAFLAEIARRNKSANFESGCRSWYINAEGRNTNNWVGHSSQYALRLRRLRLEDYSLTPA